MGDVDLSGVYAKLGRAKRYATELTESIEARFNPNAYHFTFEFNAEAHQYASIVHGLPEVDPDWSLVVGEIVFQLRSCLDHLAWQISLFDDVTPGDKTSYPIRDSPLNSKGVERVTNLRPPITSKALIDALESTQPYRTVDNSIDLGTVATSQLRALRVLNNIDKHRLLLVAAAVLDVSNMWWGLPADFPSPKIILNPGVLKDHAPVAWFDFGSHEPPDGFDPHPAVQIALREPEVAFLTQVSLTNFMDALCDFWVKEYIIEWRILPILEGRAPLFPTGPEITVS